MNIECDDYPIFDGKFFLQIDDDVVVDMDVMEECSKELESYSYSEGKKEIIEKLIDAIGSMDPDSITELMEEYRK